MTEKERLLNLYLELSHSAREKEFWTPKQVSVLLNRTDSRVRQMADEDRIPSIKILGRLFVHMPSLIDRLHEDGRG